MLVFLDFHGPLLILLLRSSIELRISYACQLDGNRIINQATIANPAFTLAENIIILRQWMCSYVLYKDFLSDTKRDSSSTPHLSRVTIRDLIKQIHKAKFTIRDHIKKGHSLPSSHRNHAPSPYLKDKNSTIFRKSKKQGAIHYSYTRTASHKKSPESKSPQMLHENLLTFNEPYTAADRNSLKMCSKPRPHPGEHSEARPHIKRHRKTELLKLEVTLNPKSKRAKSEMGKYLSIDSETLAKGRKRSKSNLLSPQQLRNTMIAQRIGLKRTGMSRASPLKDVSLRVGSSLIRLTLKEEEEPVHHELKSSKVIFQKKDSLRKEFLINVKKLHQINTQQLQEARNQQKRCSRHSSHNFIGLERREKGVELVGRKVKKEPLRREVPRRHNTETLKLRQDIEIGSIEPW